MVLNPVTLWKAIREYAAANDTDSRLDAMQIIEDHIAAWTWALEDVSRKYKALRGREENEYPECEKMAAIQEKSQAIGEFLEWLHTGEADESGFERPVFLGAYRIVTENSRGELDEDEYYVSESYVDAFRYITEKLLAKFFDIDLNKVEEERRTMLAKLRKES